MVDRLAPFRSPAGSVNTDIACWANSHSRLLLRASWTASLCHHVLPANPLPGLRRHAHAHIKHAPAGIAGGIMGTLAGLPGPPLIMMYALLNVPKVRACRYRWCLHNAQTMAASGRCLSHCWLIPTLGTAGCASPATLCCLDILTSALLRLTWRTLKCFTRAAPLALHMPLTPPPALASSLIACQHLAVLTAGSGTRHKRCAVHRKPTSGDLLCHWRAGKEVHNDLHICMCGLPVRTHGWRSNCPQSLAAHVLLVPDGHAAGVNIDAVCVWHSRHPERGIKPSLT